MMKLYELNPPGWPYSLSTTWSNMPPGEDEYAALVWERQFARDDHGVLPSGIVYTGPFHMSMLVHPTNSEPVWTIEVRVSR